MSGSIVPATPPAGQVPIRRGYWAPIATHGVTHMKTAVLVFATVPLLALVPARAEIPKPEKFDDTGFVKIFDGKTLDGWKVSAKTGHSRASMNKTGGKWVVENGAMVGSQDVPGNGGIIITE